MKLYISPKHFILQTLDLGTQAQLVMERNSGRCFCTESFNPLEKGSSPSQLYYLDCFFILGIIPIENVFFLAAVTEADVVDTLKSHNIYEIKDVELIPFESVTQETELLSLQKQNICKLLTSGFYFSYNYDLTNPMQRSPQGETQHERADTRFYWNYELYRDLLQQAVDTQWCIPVIQGYIGIYRVNQGNHFMTLALISRRSCERTGTRYNCRGVDDEGNVANFVETEQVLEVGSRVYSFVQIRGSVPIFWEQTGMTAQLALTRSREMNTHAFKKHLENIVSKYSHVCFVNLLSTNKSHEKMLTDEWEAILNKVYSELSSKIAYHFFDFHHNCKNKYDNIYVFLRQIQDMLNYHMFYQEQNNNKEVFQKGVMRTNCLDCLDRTNVLQSYLAWYVITVQLRMAGIDFNYRLEDAGTLPLCRAFKHLWGDNGDVLSMQYTGTGSTISSVTREGKKSIKGIISHGWRSIGRFYNANIEDAARQESIDAVLRRKGRGGLMSKVEEEISKRESEYTKYSQLRIRIVTWNMAGRKLPTECELLNLLVDEEPPDMVIVCFQEIVKLNPRNVINAGSNTGAITGLKEILTRTLGGTYYLLGDDSLIGCALFLYASERLYHKITEIATDKVKVGFRGKMGNKGAVAIRFNVLDTSFCILNCHLASGSDQNEARKNQIIDIHKKAFQKETIGRQTQYRVDDHDVKILCGDLNFRIALSNQQVRYLVARGEYGELFKAEQLSQARKAELRSFKECEINFPPTYKYDVGTDNYDTSKKQRTPAWCDRVLFRGDCIEPLAYNYLNLRYSDHKPVFAEFRVKVKQIDIERKNQLSNSLYAALENPVKLEVQQEKPEEVDLLGLE